ncbi:unnamed protein product [Prorocentrum cordatum]|uniref:Phytanoyl-CoA dioxygenase n=1 Tax=Prorocentrum cordatum TaxID=2364126 RepID=A0ABN9V4F5_9DINO|nr:unnamed protein product [Polarella glacialis]
MAWMDTTVRAHLFPILQAVRELASCLLAADEPVMNYVIARAKLPGSAKQHIPWHQDMSYSLMAATRARERSEALPELSAHADRSLVLHVPLTDETTANGALMYAKGSHRDGLHPRFFQEAWRSPDGEPSGSELGGGFADGHEGVETLETRAGDVLAHTLFTHHGSHPNDSPGVRWHLEVGVQDASLTNHWGYHRPPLPAGLSRHELAQWLGDLAAMQQGLCASGAEPTACG